MPLNVNKDNLTEMHGAKAEEVFREICDLGGYGAVGVGQGCVQFDYPGGLDIQGAIDPGNTAITSKAKDRIAELAGVKRKDSDNFKTTSSADKLGK